MSRSHSEYIDKFKEVLNKAGFTNVQINTDTLQGSIYKAVKRSTSQPVVIKVTNKYLHQNNLAIAYNKKHKNIKENILSEASILKYLTDKKNTPKSMIKYCGFLECTNYYYLVMNDGGNDLFEFVRQAHKLISKSLLDVYVWQKTVKIIFKQMIECIEFLHENNVCHMDISLENLLINTSNNLNEREYAKLICDCDSIQISLIDFGLAEYFPKTHSCQSKKFCGKSPYKSPEIVNKQEFNAESNDIWCCGISLFMLIFGAKPWKKAAKTETLFCLCMNGDFVKVLETWNAMHYVNDDLIDLFQSFFQYENHRITMKEIKSHPWLKW